MNPSLVDGKVIGIFLQNLVKSHISLLQFEIEVPSISALVANKLGLPADYKNRFDVAILLPLCNMDKLIKIITETNDWSDLVLRRMPKIIIAIKVYDEVTL